MKRSNTQFERQIDIDRRIRSNQFPSVPQLAADWEVDERTIKRDIEFMRDRLGAPIEYDRKKRGYCYSESNWSVPAILLREGELVALLLARRALEQYADLPFAEMLNHFYAQLLETAGKQMDTSADRIVERFSFIPPPSFPVDAQIWETLCRCLLKSHTAELSYKSVSTPSEKTYRMDPVHIANIEGEWYLFARSHYKGDIVQLALSRIQRAEDTEVVFQQEPWGSDELEQILFGRYASLQGTEEQVRILVDSERAAQVYQKQWHAQQEIAHSPDGSVEISFPVNSGGSKQPYANVISWVLSMGAHAQVQAPEKLKQLVRKEIEAMSGRYS